MKKHFGRAVSVLVTALSLLLLLGNYWLFDNGLVTRAARPEESSRTTSELSPANAPLPPTKSIEAIQVGQRVAFLENPIEPFDRSLGYVVDPATWRQIELRPNDHSRVVLLRPQWWIDARLNRDGTRLSLSVPEVGISGESEVVSVRPCPQLATGTGSVVTGTFAHTAVETIELHVEGLAEPIRCTPNHPFWSPTRQEFVEAADLGHSDFVQGLQGLHRITQIKRIPTPVRVYNLEVHGQHVYQVSTSGLIVHNMCPDIPGPQISRNAAFRQAKYDAGFPRSFRHSEVRHVPLTDKYGKVILDSSGKPILTREYVFKRSDGEEILIQEHSAGHYYGAPGGVGDQGPHFNVRPASDPRHGHVPGTQPHYPFDK